MNDQADSHQDSGRKETVSAAPAADPIPVRIGFFSQQELAFGDVVRAGLSAIRDAYASGISRKQLRKDSGLKKKAFRQVEDMDMNARLGDVLSVLAAAGKTLQIVDKPAESENKQPERRNA